MCRVYAQTMPFSVMDASIFEPRYPRAGGVLEPMPGTYRRTTVFSPQFVSLMCKDIIK